MITEARFAQSHAQPLSARDAAFPRPESRASTKVALVSSGFIHSARTSNSTPHSLPTTARRSRPVSGRSVSSCGMSSGRRSRPRSAIAPRTKFPPDPDDVIVKDWRFFLRAESVWNDPVRTPDNVRKYIWRPDLDEEAAQVAEEQKAREMHDKAVRHKRVLRERRQVANEQLRRRKNSRCQLQLQSGQHPWNTELRETASDTLKDDDHGHVGKSSTSRERPSSAMAPLAKHNVKSWRYFGGSVGKKNAWDIPERQAPHRIRATVDLERNQYAIRNIEEKAKEEFTRQIDEQRTRRERHDRILLRFRNQQLQNYEKERMVDKGFQRQLVAQTNVTNSEYNPKPDDEETLRREKSYDNIARGVARVNRADEPCVPSRGHGVLSATGASKRTGKAKAGARSRTKSKRTKARCSQRIKQLATPRLRTNHPERLSLDHADFAGLLVAVDQAPTLSLPLKGESHATSQSRPLSSRYATRTRPSTARSVQSTGGPLSSRRPANERWLARQYGQAKLDGASRGKERSKNGAKTARTHAEQEKEDCMREIALLEARLQEKETRTYSEETHEFLMTYRSSAVSGSDSEKENVGT